MQPIMTEPIKTRIAYEIFRGSGDMSWDKLLTSAADFASALQPDEFVNITHSSDNGHGTAVVWYRKELP